MLLVLCMTNEFHEIGRLLGRKLGFIQNSPQAVAVLPTVKYFKI